MSSEENARRERLYRHYLEDIFNGKKFSVDHLKAEKMSQSAIYFIIIRAENNLGYKRVQGSGWVA